MVPLENFSFIFVFARLVLLSVFTSYAFSIFRFVYVVQRTPPILISFSSFYTHSDLMLLSCALKFYTSKAWHHIMFDYYIDIIRFRLIPKFSLRHTLMPKFSFSGILFFECFRNSFSSSSWYRSLSRFFSRFLHHTVLYAYRKQKIKMHREGEKEPI